MKKVKTCVYAICLDEIKHVDKFVESSKEADLILVCDTGSTDGTVERLRELGVQVYNIRQRPWRFDIPRNTALSLIPDDIDICLSIDLDEYLQPGWSNALDNAWQTHQGKIKRIRYDYIWNWKEDNITPDVRFYADKIHHRKGYIWKHPCHETLYWDNPSEEELFITIPEIILHHRADNTKSRSQYLNLLELAVKEDPTNDRMSHYYGRELFFNYKFEDAIKEFDRHLSLLSARWNEERAASYRYMSRCYRNIEKLKESQDVALKGVQECDHVRETWLELARAAYTIQDWHTCYWAATKCLSINNRTMSYMADNSAWGYEPYDLAAIAAYFLDNKQMAQYYGVKAQELSPNDDRLKKNLDFYFDKVQ